MISKCANPDCDARFRYLRSGKLFHFEVAVEPVATKYSGTGLRPVPKKAAQKVEHFWLCDECAASMTLKQDRAHGVIVIPVKKHSQRATA